MILLARHGETDDNREPERIQGSRDVRLNATGRCQAGELARRARELAGRAPRSLWSSQLARARETAAIAGRQLGLDARVDARLAESHRGRWEGRLWRDIEREEPDGYARWRRAGEMFRFPGGESLGEHRDRVLAALAEIRAGSAAPVVVVCHGGTIRVALCAAEQRGLDAFHELAVPNGALLRL